MALEKVVKDLLDLRQAAAAAAKEGVCRIRLDSGESLLLYPSRETPVGTDIHDVTDPVEREAVISCMEPGGKTYSTGEALEEIRRRQLIRTTKKSDEPR